MRLLEMTIYTLDFPISSRSMALTLTGVMTTGAEIQSSLLHFAESLALSSVFQISCVDMCASCADLSPVFLRIFRTFFRLLNQLCRCQLC